MSAADDEYAPYDPLQVAGALPLAGIGDEPEDPVPSGLPAFDERYREPFTGLVYIGALTKAFSFLGHRIVIRSLKDDEQLAVALLVREYGGTIGEAKAYTRAVVAQCLVSVDGHELPLPLGEGADIGTWAQQRFDWLGRSWYPTTIGAIYEAYLELDETVAQVVDAMGKASLQLG